MTASADKCPVDHSTSSSSFTIWNKLFGSYSNSNAKDVTSSSQSSKQAKSLEQQCPVDHSSSNWAGLVAQNSSSESAKPSNAPLAKDLPTDRVVSSIPRTDSQGNWIYPSQQQFFNALARKKHNPREADMKVVVPIHNAVNERAWTQILQWENGRGGEACGGIKLATFRGRPNDTSPKAWVKSFLGYQKPFDRHDWVVNRCGTQVRYIIDFYTGKSLDPSAQSLAFYLDVRPALDNWEGVKMRIERFWDRVFNSNTMTDPSATPNSPPARATKPS